MKKIIPISLLSLALCCSFLAGCGQAPDPSKSESTTTSSSQTTSTKSEESKSEAPIYDEDSIRVHYNIDTGDYSSRALWMWNKVLNNGAEYTYNGTDNFGAVASYKLSDFGGDVLKDGLGLIDKSKGSWSDQSKDLFVDFTKAFKDQNKAYHVWLKHSENDKLYYEEPEIGFEITTCAFIKIDKINIVAKDAKSYRILEGGTAIASGEFVGNLVTATLPHPAILSNSYVAEITFKKDDTVRTKEVDMFALYGTDEFNEMYYTDTELGALYSHDSTTFKVWSPLSYDIKVRVYESGTPTSVDITKGNDEYKEYSMEKGDKGVWSVKVDEYLEGKYYTYIVTNKQYSHAEIVDPYAKSAGVNGLRGMILDLSTTDPEGWDCVHPVSYDRKELTVWETHIADVTSSNTWGGTAKNAKKYAGMYEKGTKYTKGGVTVSTGFDHIKELGVNAVQLLPIFDQANDEVNVTFNWGYNPLNYNVLEGCYSSNPYDGKVRIKEFKQLVDAYRSENINIIMDVVYNHVNSVSNSNFDVLFPGYYFRYDANKNLYNGSGCGNETASDHKMFRKFMIDSACFWAKEYKLGGFRFDLMGLHDIETMNELTKAVKEINPNIVIYGEPWTGGTSGLDTSKQAIQANMNSYVGYGCFNDQMRDALVKGGLNAATAKGWAMDNTLSPTLILEGIKGNVKDSLGEPDKTVNYVTCHDNYCLYDRMKAAGITDENKIKSNSMLANAVVFTSQGTSFMLAGEECTRTKDGNNNSYNASYKVNEINYERKLDNLSTFENYKKLIKIKQDVNGLHYNKEQVKSNVTVVAGDNNSLITTTIKDGTKTYMILHANGNSSSSKVDLSGYSVLLDTLNKYATVSGQVTIYPYQSLVLVK